MKVAVTMFKQRISPRLDIADSLWIYLIDKTNKTATLMEICSAPCDPPFLWLTVLMEKGINTIICGGCPHFFLRMFVFHNIDVVPGVLSDPEQVLAWLANGKHLEDSPLLVNRFSYPSCLHCCQDYGTDKVCHRNHIKGSKNCLMVTEENPGNRVQ